MTKWETTSEVVRVGAFQYLKGCHEGEIELFFVTLVGKTRACHFILALEQSAFGGSKLPTTGEISHSLGWPAAKAGKKLLVWVGRLSKMKLWPGPPPVFV